MGIQAGLLKLYFEIEGKYYQLCDWLERQSVPVYKYFVDPLEKTGWPSFPIACALLLLLLSAFVFILSAPSMPVSKSVYVKVFGNNSEPIQGALVELVSSGNVVVVSSFTNATGEAFFQERKNAVQIRVTHPNYEVALSAVGENANVQLNARQVQATPPAGRRVEQANNSFQGDVNQFIDIEQFGSFEVRLVQLSGLPASGVIRVFDAATDNEITEAQSVGGVAVFENLPLNQHVYFHSLVQGFIANRTQEFIVTRQRQSVSITLVPVPVVNTTVSILSQATRQPLQSVEVKVFNEENVVVANASTPASGNLTFSLPAVGGRYYVNAKKATFITNVSEFFLPSSNITVVLSPASSDAASLLRVRFKDEYNNSLAGRATVYTSDNRVLDQGRFARDVQEFTNLPRNSSVTVKASAMDLTANRSLVLTEAVNEVLLVMEVRFAFLMVSTLSALTNQPIAGVNVEVTRDRQPFANCTAAPCTFRVKTRGVHLVNLSSSEYFNYLISYGATYNHQAFEEGTTTNLTALMMPLSAVQDSQIVLNGVFDASTYEFIPAGGTLKQNKVYLASLSGYFANASIASAFFTPSTSGNNRVSILNFTPHPFSATSSVGLEVQASSLSTPSECGASFIGGASGKLKRVLLHVPLDASTPYGQSYSVLFVAETPVFPSDDYSNLTVGYKSFIKKTSGETIRNPYDSERGTSEPEYSGASSECASQMYTSAFNVVSPNEERNELGVMRVSFVQDRSLSAVERVNRSASCGTVTGLQNSQGDFDSFDCNGFSVDAGFAKPLEINAYIRLSSNARQGIVRFHANPSRFSVLNASFTVGSKPPEYLATTPASAVFDYPLSTALFGINGANSLNVKVNLSATGNSPRSEITVEFLEVYENGTVASVSLNKTIWVSVNEVVSQSSTSLLSGFSCGSQSSVTFSYDEGLITTGSGWQGCSEIPIIVDPIFPADAVPIYIENTTGAGDCRVINFGGSFASSVVFSPTVTGGNGCFELVDQDAYSPEIFPRKEGYRGYVLKLNAVKCGKVVGNDINVFDGKLELVCNGRNPRGFGFDNKTVNLKVIKQSGENLKNLVIRPIQVEFTARIFSQRAGGVYFYNPTTANGLCPAGSKPAVVFHKAVDATPFTAVTYEILNNSYNLNNANAVYPPISYLSEHLGTKYRLYKNPDVAECGKPVQHYFKSGATPRLINWTIKGELNPQLNASFPDDPNIVLGSTADEGLIGLPEHLVTSQLLLGTGQSDFFGEAIVKESSITTYLRWVEDRCTFARSCNQNNETARQECEASREAECNGEVTPQMLPQDDRACYYCAASTIYTNSKTPPRGNNYAFAYFNSQQEEMDLDPQVWLVVDNLQLKSAAQSRPFTFNFPYEAAPLTLDDVASPAYSLAVQKGFSFSGGKLNISENGVVLSSNAFSSFDDLSSTLYRDDGSLRNKPLLHYIEKADQVLKATAMRRSGETVYYCLQNRAPDITNTGVCRPTIEDWVRDVASPATRTEPCTACQNRVNCNSACSADGRLPDGRQCFNWCGTPVCDLPAVCVNSVKTVEVPGRTNQEWVNSTQLIAVKLSDVAGDDPLARNSPLKFFLNDDGKGIFNYSMAVNLGKSCTDNYTNFLTSPGGCFANASTNAFLASSYGVDNLQQMIEFGTGSIKLTESQGGCDYSTKWSRGFYRLTFSYAPTIINNAPRWKWTIYADPLEVSKKYVQDDPNANINSCAAGATSLLDGRRTQLCYFTFATNASRIAEGNVGNCLRSLRDYIPRSYAGQTSGSFDDRVTEDKLEVFNRDDVPESIAQTFTPEQLIYRNMDLYAYGNTKCGRWDDAPSFTEAPLVCMGGNKCWPTVLPPSVDFNVTTFAVSRKGTLDRIRGVGDAVGGECASRWTRQNGYENNYAGSGTTVDVTLRYSVLNAGGVQAVSDDVCIVACAADSRSSCPYVYSFDGKDYRFEHEAFPQAGNQQEESYSYSQLQFLKQQSGVVKLRSAEVKPEVSFTNVVKVFALDTAKNLPVMPDEKGVFHTLGSKISPMSAVSETGENILSKVAVSDGVAWAGQIDMAGQSTATLTFDVPANAKGAIPTNAKLLFALRRSSKLDNELDSLRAQIGDNYLMAVQGVIDKLPSFVYRWVYDTWVKRRMALSVKVLANSQWSEVASLRVAEPDQRLIYFELPANSVNGKLTVKLEMLGNSYEVDEVYADFSDDEKISVNELRVSKAVDQRGNSVVALIASDDDKRYEQYEGDYVDLEFVDIGTKPGYIRSYALAIKGYSIPFSGSYQTIESFVSKGLPTIVKSIFDKGYTPSQG